MIWGNIWGTERTRSLTPGDKNYLVRVSRGKCEYCGQDIIGKGITPNIHHIVEFASRGSDDYHNLIVLCPNCHSLVHGIGISKEKLRAKIAYRLPKKASANSTIKGAVAAKKTVAKKTTAKKATAKKAKSKQTATKKATTKKTTLKKASAGKTKPKRTSPKRASTRKTMPKRTTARKRP